MRKLKLRNIKCLAQHHTAVVDLGVESSSNCLPKSM